MILVWEKQTNQKKKELKQRQKKQAIHLETANNVPVYVCNVFFLFIRFWYFIAILNGPLSIIYQKV